MNNDRNLAIDFTKGLLVVGMVLYHSIDYFTHGSLLIKYIRFITGAFVFISGFLISNVYLKKYDLNESKIYLRLFSRGIKLILTFTGLNLAANLFFAKNYDGRELNVRMLMDNIYYIYIPGDYKLAAFEILLPIAYLMFISGALIMALRKRFKFISLLFAALFVYCSVEIFNTDAAYNFIYITIGMFGITLGFIPDYWQKRLFDHKYLVICSYIAYLIFISLYKLYYPVYVGSVLLNLIVIYMLGARLASQRMTAGKLIFLGRYSLLSYIVQIAVLQMLVRVFAKIPLNEGKVLVGFVLTTVLMVVSIHAVDYFKEKSQQIDRLYKMIFN